MTHVLHTVRISNDERVLYNDTQTNCKGQYTRLFTSFICDTRPTCYRISNEERVVHVQ